MALETISTESLPEGEAEVLSGILAELQGLTISVATGAADGVNINVAGIATEDTLVSVIHFDTGVPSDVTDEATITSAGHIQCADTDTTGDKLIVVWFNKS